MLRRTLLIFLLADISCVQAFRSTSCWIPRQTHAERGKVKRTWRGGGSLSHVTVPQPDLVYPEEEAGNDGDQARSELTRLDRQSRVKRKIGSAIAGACKRHHFDAELLALALPTLGVVLIDPFLSLVDTGYVGRLGALSLAALGPCAAAFNFVFVSASSALVVSTAVMISKQRAMNERGAIGRTIILASALSAVLGLVMAAIFGVYSVGVLSIMGAPIDVMELAVPYLRWRALAFPSTLFLLASCGIFRGMGEPKVSLVNAIVVAIVNLVLDPLLMFKCGLGVAGAAIATAAAQSVGALVYLRYIWSRRLDLGLERTTGFPRLNEVKEFFGAGGTMVFRQLCNIGAWTVMASVATRMGILEIAAHQLILALWLVIAFTQEALGSSGQVLVARHLGPVREAQTTLGRGGSRDGDALHMREIARSIAKRVLSLSFGLGLVLATLSRGLFPMVLPMVCHSTQVADVVLKVLPAVLYAFPMCCLVWTWDALFYGASDFAYNAKTVAVASSLAVGGSILSLQLGWGIKGLWMSMTYILFGVRLASHLWRFNSARGPFGSSEFWSGMLAKSPDNPLIKKEA